jgi:lysophospholipase L1-like esterase
METLKGMSWTVSAALLVCLAGSSLVDRDAWAQAAEATATVESAARLAAMEAKLADWPQLARYREANAALGPAAEGEGRVVFFGASMTEFWGKNGTKFFPGKPYVNRGISGQTTAQMVVRFRQDVIDLHPKAVVILAGTNDVAGNTGPMTAEMTENNWQSMADMAKVNGIRVIFASITPSTDFWWHKGLKPAEKIRTLNVWLKGYCASHGLTYLDYYSTLTDEEGGMKKEFTVDGVHASARGYAVMQPLAQAAIDKTLAN